MSAARDEMENRIDIADIARSTLDAANGDALKASALLEQHARRDVKVANALLLPLLHQACYDAIRAVCKLERGYIWRQAASDLARHNSEGANRVRSHGRRLMDFILPHGAMRIGEATNAELLRAVDFYRKQARTEMQRARWIELIAQHVEGRRKVKNALTEDRLSELYQQAVEDV